MVMQLERKAFTVQVKATDPPGTFSGYAAVWDNIDSYGDVMVRGAFASSIEARGLPMLSWEHAWPQGPIGILTDAVEDDKGLLVTGRLFIDSDLPNRVWQSMKAGGIQEMSFAFLTKESAEGDHEGETVRFLKEVDWLEAAVVIKGANDLAQIVQVRSGLYLPEPRSTSMVTFPYHDAPWSRLGDKGAISPHETRTTEGAWDGPAAVAAMPNDAATLRYCHAWIEAGADADAKGSYKFPHHRTKGGPAVLPGVRNGLARISQSSIPEGDKAGVTRHLRAHLEDAQTDSASLAEHAASDADFAASLDAVVDARRAEARAAAERRTHLESLTRREWWERETEGDVT